jgi:UDP-2-acetamido-3-amino-2,3-dideoxy-glucuronate N-acetyltransferase
MGHFQHPQALVDTSDIGEGTRVWAFAHVMSGAKVGRGCNIGEHCFIEDGAIVGNDVTVKNYVAVWRGVTIEDGAFVGPHATLTNDRRPRSGRPDWTLVSTRIGRGATIGANATVVCGIEIGAYAFVGAGSVVTSSVPAHRLVYGNPARAHGYVCCCAEPLIMSAERGQCPACGSRFQVDPQRGLVAEA